MAEMGRRAELKILPSLPLCHDPPDFPPGTSSATGDDVANGSE